MKHCFKRKFKRFKVGMLDFDQVGRDLNWVVKSKKKKKTLRKPWDKNHLNIISPQIVRALLRIKLYINNEAFPIKHLVRKDSSLLTHTFRKEIQTWTHIQV